MLLNTVQISNALEIQRFDITGDQGHINALQSKKVQMRAFRAWGALACSWFNSITEMDAPSSFYFHLEQNNRQKMIPTCCKNSNRGSLNKACSSSQADSQSLSCQGHRWWRRPSIETWLTRGLENWELMLAEHTLHCTGSRRSPCSMTAIWTIPVGLPLHCWGQTCHGQRTWQPCMVLYYRNIVN